MRSVSARDPVVEKGREIFRRMEGLSPAIFDRRRRAGQAMEAAMGDPDLKVRLFRFVDVFPALATADLVARHLREYFLADASTVPPFLRPLLSGAASGPAAGITAALLRRNMLELARTFIAGATPGDALPALRRIRDEGRTFSVDLLGEAAVSEAEAQRYRDRYLSLASELAAWQVLEVGKSWAEADADVTENTMRRGFSPDAIP